MYESSYSKTEFLFFPCKHGSEQMCAFGWNRFLPLGTFTSVPIISYLQNELYRIWYEFRVCLTRSGRMHESLPTLTDHFPNSSSVLAVFSCMCLEWTVPDCVWMGNRIAWHYKLLSTAKMVVYHYTNMFLRWCFCLYKDAQRLFWANRLNNLCYGPKTFGIFCVLAVSDVKVTRKQLDDS